MTKPHAVRLVGVESDRGPARSHDPNRPQLGITTRIERDPSRSFQPLDDAITSALESTGKRAGFMQGLDAHGEPLRVIE